MIEIIFLIKQRLNIITVVETAVKATVVETAVKATVVETAVKDMVVETAVKAKPNSLSETSYYNMYLCGVSKHQTDTNAKVQINITVGYQFM